MKKWICAAAGMAAVLACFFVFQTRTAAKGNGVNYIQNGIFIGDIDVSGMQKEEAKEAVDAYIAGLEEVPLVLNAVGGNQISLTAGNLGIIWENPEVLDEALSLGKQGNIVKRYKALKELERNPKNMIWILRLIRRP